ncbi:MAG: MBL fold metallo-hydrolase, partial [Nevskiales bacterium]
MRKLIRWVLILAVLAGGYYWMVLDSRMPADASYPLDMVEVRRLAESVPGTKPTQLRYEHVYNGRFIKGMTVTGDGWSGADLAVYSYQVVYPSHTAIIDTAMSHDAPLPSLAKADYDTDAWQRVLKAMDKASLIVITHEHMDHIGG